MNPLVRRLHDTELFDVTQFRPGHDSLSDTQISRALDRPTALDVTKPRTETERLQEICTKVDPNWMEHFDSDLTVARDFYRKFAPECWAKAETEIGS